MDNTLLNLLIEQRKRIAKLRNTKPWGAEYEVWKTTTRDTLEKLLGEKYAKLLRGMETVIISTDETERNELYSEELDRMEIFIDSSIEEFERLKDIPSKPVAEAGIVLSPTKANEVPLVEAKQPDSIGIAVWILQFPARFNRYITKYIKNSAARILFIFILIILIILLALKAWGMHENAGYFEYQPDETAYAPKSVEQPNTIDVRFQANVTNFSSSPRYLSNLIDVLWKNESLGSTWDEGFTDAFGTVYLVQNASDTPETLPILFQPNESKTLAWQFEFTISDPATMQWLSETQGQGVFTTNKNEIEFLMQDSRGNIFNQQGELQSQPVMDAWWLLPNNRSLSQKVPAYIGLVYKIAVWKIKEFIPLPN